MSILGVDVFPKSGIHTHCRMPVLLHGSPASWGYFTICPFLPVKLEILGENLSVKLCKNESSYQNHTGHGTAFVLIVPYFVIYYCSAKNLMGCIFTVLVYM